MTISDLIDLLDELYDASTDSSNISDHNGWHTTSPRMELPKELEDRVLAIIRAHRTENADQEHRAIIKCTNPECMDTAAELRLVECALGTFTTGKYGATPGARVTMLNNMVAHHIKTNAHLAADGTLDKLAQLSNAERKIEALKKENAELMDKIDQINRLSVRKSDPIV